MEQPEQMAAGGMRTENLHSGVGGARLAAVTDTCVAPLRLGSPQEAAKLDTPFFRASAGSEVIR